MKIVYFHDRLLRNIYRCAQVRSRLQRFLQTHPVDVILVSTHTKSKEGLQPCDLIRLDKGTSLYVTQDALPMEGVKLYEDSLVIGETVFKPADGTIFEIDTDPELRSTAIFMDFFSDERFEDYHSDLSEDQIMDLQDEFKKKKHYN